MANLQFAVFNSLGCLLPTAYCLLLFALGAFFVILRGNIRKTGFESD